MIEKRQTGEDRARHILDVAAEHEGRNLTIAQLAALCGRVYGDRFSRDLSRARHIALDEGHKLSHCAFHEGANVLTYRESVGSTVTVKGLRKVGRTAATYTRNAGRAGQWEAEHGESRATRAYGSLYYTWAQASELLLNGIAEFERQLGDNDDGGGVGAR